MSLYIKQGTNLFDNQKENVKKLVRRRRALLTDRVGSGKTLSVLYSFAYLKEKGKLNNLLILTPLSAYEKLVWKKDIVKFTNFRAIDLDTLSQRVVGNFDYLQKILTQYDVIFGKHSHVKQYLDLIKQIVRNPNAMLCVDEVHAFKNPKSQLTQLFRSASLLTTNFWALTGTSLSKDLEDTYNIVNLVSPWYLGAFTTFRDTYCVTMEQVIGRRAGALRKALKIVGVKNEQMLNDKLDPLIIKGENNVEIQHHFVDYEMSQDEINLYRKIANGIELNEGLSSEEWIRKVLEGDDVVPSRDIKSVERHSSRFIYLQTAADGVLSDKGTQDKTDSVKVNKLIDLLKEIVSRGESTLVYFDYYATLEVVEHRVRWDIPQARLLKSTGESVLKDTDVTEAKVKMKPHIILCTKASAESASYYFINNTVFFHIPTVPHVYVQFNGRITRRNTLFPHDLHSWIFRSNNIDLYKLGVVSAKSYQMEVVQGEEQLVPPDYKKVMRKVDQLEKMKKLLLWRV